MDILTALRQVAWSLFVRRKKWIILTTSLAVALLVPVAYLMSKEPPRYQTVATVFLESKAGSPLFQEFSPFRPLSVQLAILQSRILAQSDTPLAEIALAVGYSDQSHFATAFKRQTGFTPSQFRKMLRNG